MEISKRLIFFVVEGEKEGIFSCIVYVVTMQWIYEYACVVFRILAHI